MRVSNVILIIPLFPCSYGCWSSFRQCTRQRQAFRTRSCRNKFPGFAGSGRRVAHKGFQIEHCGTFVCSRTRLDETSASRWTNNECGNIDSQAPEQRRTKRNYKNIGEYFIRIRASFTSLQLLTPKVRAPGPDKAHSSDSLVSGIFCLYVSIIM